MSTNLKRSAPKSINDFPVEVLLQVFQYLDLNFVAKCSKICKHWREIIARYIIAPELSRLSKERELYKNFLEKNGWTEECNDTDLIMYLYDEPCSSSKVLLSGGLGDMGNWLTDTEILDLKTGQKWISSKLPNLPKATAGVTGGLLGDYPVVCGGFDRHYQSSQDCYAFGKHTISFTSHMKNKRAFSASAPKNQSLWVTGGCNKLVSYHKSTEFIQKDGSILPGPDMPVALDNHAFIEVKTNETYMLIGGSSPVEDYCKASYIFSVSSDTWQKGPKLNIGRRNHTAGIIMDNDNLAQYAVVVGGFNRKILTSVEILNLSDQSSGWFQGPALPMALYNHQMVQWDNNLVVLGGRSLRHSYSSRLYMLQCHNGVFTWQLMTPDMSKSRIDFVAMKIPNSLVEKWAS